MYESMLQQCYGIFVAYYFVYNLLEHYHYSSDVSQIKIPLYNLVLSSIINDKIMKWKQIINIGAIAEK